MQDDDERCCGTGTCIIDPQGHCWCGQVWDGQKMCRPVAMETHSSSAQVQASEPSVQSQADHT